MEFCSCTKIGTPRDDATYRAGPEAKPPVPTAKSGLKFLIIFLAFHKLEIILKGRPRFLSKFPLSNPAIVHGGLLGVGPGKSALKHSLPQSASDFIFAIIVEEYGLLGASILMIAYFIMLMRIVIIATKIPTFYGTLLVLSIGMMIFLQLAVNIAVAVNIIPVTGQPLPLISYGGTSMLVTYIQLGIVLNISSRIQVLGEEGLGEKQIAKEMSDIA